MAGSDAQPNFTGSTTQIQCFKTRLCHFYQQQRCTRGTQCLFAHSGEEVRFPPDLTKTKICVKWKRGICRHGNYCTYAHGIAELRPLEGGEMIDSPNSQNFDYNSMGIPSPNGQISDEHKNACLNSPLSYHPHSSAIRESASNGNLQDRFQTSSRNPKPSLDQHEDVSASYNGMEAEEYSGGSSAGGYDNEEFNNHDNDYNFGKEYKAGKGKIMEGGDRSKSIAMRCEKLKEPYLSKRLISVDEQRNSDRGKRDEENANPNMGANTNMGAKTNMGANTNMKFMNVKNEMTGNGSGGGARRFKREDYAEQEDNENQDKANPYEESRNEAAAAGSLDRPAFVEITCNDNMTALSESVDPCRGDFRLDGTRWGSQPSNCFAAGQGNTSISMKATTHNIAASDDQNRKQQNRKDWSAHPANTTRAVGYYDSDGRGRDGGSSMRFQFQDGSASVNSRGAKHFPPEDAFSIRPNIDQYCCTNNNNNVASIPIPQPDITSPCQNSREAQTCMSASTRQPPYRFFVPPPPPEYPPGITFNESRKSSLPWNNSNGPNSATAPLRLPIPSLPRERYMAPVATPMQFHRVTPIYPIEADSEFEESVRHAEFDERNNPIKQEGVLCRRVVQPSQQLMINHGNDELVPELDNRNFVRLMNHKNDDDCLLRQPHGNETQECKTERCIKEEFSESEIKSEYSSEYSSGCSWANTDNTMCDDIASTRFSNHLFVPMDAATSSIDKQEVIQTPALILRESELQHHTTQGQNGISNSNQSRQATLPFLKFHSAMDNNPNDCSQESEMSVSRIKKRNALNVPLPLLSNQFISSSGTRHPFFSPSAMSIFTPSTACCSSPPSGFPFSPLTSPTLSGPFSPTEFDLSQATTSCLPSPTTFYSPTATTSTPMPSAMSSFAASLRPALAASTAMQMEAAPLAAVVAKQSYIETISMLRYTPEDLRRAMPLQYEE